jgi:hypothetical protein
MMFHPGTLALLVGSALTTSMLCYSACEGVRIIRGWDIHSGSEQQLELERRTYLVSMIMSYAMGFQVLSLFLFIYTADTLSPFFIGAMCAAGSLKINGFGYPTLIIKIAGCLLAGIWLIINTTDNKADDYPLIQIKYWLLLFIAPILIAETTLQGLYLLNLKPNIITSCCAVLFATDADTIVSDLVALPHALSQTIFFISALSVMTLGLYVCLKAQGAILFAIITLGHFLISIVALISFVSIYLYELPTHHCPFCLLHQEYGYVGYFLYAAILISTVTGIGTGVINPFRSISSLHQTIPRIQKKLALVSMLATAVFVTIIGNIILLSSLSMAEQ